MLINIYLGILLVIHIIAALYIIYKESNDPLYTFIQYRISLYDCMIILALIFLAYLSINKT